MRPDSGVSSRGSGVPCQGDRALRTLTTAATAVVILAFAPTASADAPSARFATTVSAVLAQPYQADYVPVGLDSAFDQPTLNTAPAEDYTTGSIPDSPDYPAWPTGVTQVLFTSGDGAPLF